MARIRTIKPEMPQSESLGRVSRDARLLFLMLITCADDEGRGRGAARMLASTLFPFDDDAKDKIDDWLAELERENSIVRYTVEGSTYFQIVKWTEHQKIDKPTPSRLPAPSGLISENRSERQIELLLYNAIERSRALFGHNIISVQRQIRIGSRYLDIVAKSETHTFVIELKKTNIAQADLEQVLEYSKLVKGTPILVGPGISAQFDVGEALKNQTAIVTFDSELTLSLALASELISGVPEPLDNARERQPLDLGPRKGPRKRTKDQGPEASAELPAAHAPVASPVPHVIAIPTNQRGEEFIVSQAHFTEFEKSYPAVDVRQELRAMRAWSIANHRQRKTADGMLRFINAWLSKAQNNAKDPSKSRISAHDKGSIGLAAWVDLAERTENRTGTSGGAFPTNGHEPGEMDDAGSRLLGRLPSPEPRTIEGSVQTLSAKRG